MNIVITLLASGSTGNAVLLQAGGASVLFDAGLSRRELQRRATAVGVDLSAVSALFVSHEHTDHIAAVPLLARDHDLPVYVADATREAILNPAPRRRRAPVGESAEERTARAWAKLDRIEPLVPGEAVPVGPLIVRAFRTEHDAADPVGFSVACNGYRVGIVTDLGRVTHLVRQHLRGCRALVIESNHDPRMLVDGPYPWELKQRIKGDKGHLSNAQCAETITEVWHPALRRIVLAHLSEKNNTPRLALSAAREALPGDAGRHTRVDAAEQSRPLRIRIDTDRREETA